MRMASPVVDLKKNEQGKGGNTAGRVLETSGKNAAYEVLTWQAVEFAAHEKGFWWYGLLVGATAIVVLVSVLLKNYTAAVLFVLSAVIVALFAQKSPRMLTFTADARGVQIGGRLYAYDALRSFWIFYDPPHRADLSLRSRSLFMPYIHIPLGSINPAQLHRLLSRYLPETKHAQSLADSLSQRAGF